MMTILTKVSAIFDRAVNLLGILAGALLIFLMFGISTDVVMRYFLVRPIFWMGEVSEYTLVYITFLGAAWVLKLKGHVRMDLVLIRLEPRTQALINIITSVMGSLICLLIVWGSAYSTWNHFRIGYVTPFLLGAPKFVILAVIPFGSFLLLIQFMKEAYGYHRERKGLTRSGIGKTDKLWA